MKKLIAGILLSLTSFAFAELPELMKSAFVDKFNEKNATFIDANDFAKNYSEIRMLNKTAEKIETTVYVYDSRIQKKEAKSPGWIKFGTIKVGDYNDLDSMSKQLKYKVTALKEFRYIAYVTSKTEREVKYSLSFNNEIFEIKAEYEKAVRPLASLEAKPVIEKSEDKKTVLGVKADVSFRNISDKTMKQIILSISAQDKGLVSRTNDGREEVSVIVNELVEDGERYNAETKVFWNNTAIDSIKITKVKIIYTDGSEIEY